MKVIEESESKKRPVDHELEELICKLQKMRLNYYSDKLFISCLDKVIIGFKKQLIGGEKWFKKNNIIRDKDGVIVKIEKEEECLKK